MPRTLQGADDVNEGSAMHEGPHGEEPGPEDDAAAEGPGHVGVERVLALSLRLVYIPVVVLLLAGLGAFVYGTVFFVDSIRRIVDHPFPVGHHIGLFLLDVDLFLIGATLLISAVGLYELFIGEIDRGPATRLPGWLEMRDLNDLKGRVIAMIVLVVSVSFVEVVVDAPSGRQALELGGGVALVIVALTVFLRLSGHGGESG
jgi:uncharacterized membrane protein YqhA